MQQALAEGLHIPISTMGQSNEGVHGKAEEKPKMEILDLSIHRKVT